MYRVRLAGYGWTAGDVLRTTHCSIVASATERANGYTTSRTTGLFDVVLWPIHRTGPGTTFIHSNSSNALTPADRGPHRAAHLSPMVVQHNTNYKHTDNERINTLATTVCSILADYEYAWFWTYCKAVLQKTTCYNPVVSIITVWYAYVLYSNAIIIIIIKTYVLETNDPSLGSLMV